MSEATNTIAGPTNARRIFCRLSGRGKTLTHDRIVGAPNTDHVHTKSAPIGEHSAGSHSGRAALNRTTDAAQGQVDG